jgi:hypothetical protein
MIGGCPATPIDYNTLSCLAILLISTYFDPPSGSATEQEYNRQHIVGHLRTHFAHLSKRRLKNLVRSSTIRLYILLG